MGGVTKEIERKKGGERERRYEGTLREREREKIQRKASSSSTV